MTAKEWLDSNPEFSDVSDDLKNSYIAEARLIIVASKFNADEEFIVYLQTAHMMTLVNNAARMGNGAPMTSVKEGEDSVSFANIGGSSASVYTMTSYGQLLLQFIKNECITFRTV